MSGLYTPPPAIERDRDGNVVLRMTPEQAGTVGWALMRHRHRGAQARGWSELGHDLYEIEQDEDPKPGLYIVVEGPGGERFRV